MSAAVHVLHCTVSVTQHAHASCIVDHIRIAPRVGSSMSTLFSVRIRHDPILPCSLPNMSRSMKPRSCTTDLLGQGPTVLAAPPACGHQVQVQGPMTNLMPLIQSPMTALPMEPRLPRLGSHHSPRLIVIVAPISPCSSRHQHPFVFSHRSCRD